MLSKASHNSTASADPSLAADDDNDKTFSLAAD